MRTLSRLPIKVSVPILLAAPVAVVAAALSLLAFHQARFTANDLVSQNLAQVHARIAQRVDSLLSLPPRFNTTIASLMRRGHLDPDDPRSWRHTFLEQAEAFHELSAMDWGTRDGRVVWLARYAGRDAYTFAVKDERTGGNVEIYNLDAAGEITGEPINAYPYDPRLRPWYSPAVEAGAPAWSDPFLWVPQDDSETTLGLGYSQPYRGPDGTILGVHDAEISLHDLSVFLRGLPVARTGRAFIADMDGLLVATSTGGPVASSDNGRLAATASADPFVAAAARHLDRQALGSWSDDRPYQTRLTHEGERLLLMVSPFERQPNLRWLVATLVPEEDFMAGVRAQGRLSFLLGSAAVLLALLFGILVAMRMVRPFLELVRQVRRIAAGELDHEVRIDATPEFSRVSGEINRMTAQLRDRQRLESELAVANQIQMAMLPGAGGASAAGENYEIAAVLEPAKAVGGDLYDFFPMEDGRLCVIIGDVSDKGVPAAIFMAKAVTLGRVLAGVASRPASMVADLNRELCRENDACMFVTFLCAFLDPATGAVAYASAGHDPPVLLDSRGKAGFLEPSSGAALGLYEDAAYSDRSTVLAPGDTILFYTDGVTEAANAAGDMYEDGRILKELSGRRFVSTHEMVETLLASVRRFEAGAPQADDTTILAVRFRPEEAVEETPAPVLGSIEVQADRAGLSRVQAWIEETLSARGVPGEVIFPLQHAADQVLGNILHEAGRRGEAPLTEIRLDLRVDQVRMQLRNRGASYNPLEDIEAGTDGGPGLPSAIESGIGRMKPLVDRLHYDREGGFNVVTVIRNLPGK